jgi:hypothetical protein
VKRHMTYGEKEARSQARYYGKRCRLAIEHCTFHAKEAASWRAVDGTDGTLTRMWQERADQQAKDAVTYARYAAHHGLLALAKHAADEGGAP